MISQPRLPVIATILIATAAFAAAGGDALVERAMRTWTDAAHGRFRLERTRRKDGAGATA